MILSRCGILCNQCSFRETANCPGCVNLDKPFWGECRAKGCCEAKEIEHCGECAEFPCDLLRAFSYDPEHGDNGARIEQCKQWAKQRADQHLIARAESIVKGAKNATIALVDDQGFPRASTISSLRTDGLRSAWFATGLSSGKVRCIRHSNKACLCYSDGNHNVTLMGTVEILTDLSTKRELWLDWFIDHFPGGVDDPNYCILRFNTEQAILWVDSIYREFNGEEPWTWHDAGLTKST